MAAALSFFAAFFMMTVLLVAIILMPVVTLNMGVANHFCWHSFVLPHLSCLTFDVK